MKQCRFCLEENGTDLIAPCLCKGTNKWVHRSCVDKWRQESEVAFHECPTCKFKYILILQGEIDVKKQKRLLYLLLTRDLLLIFISLLILSYSLGLIIGNEDPFVTGSCALFYVVGIIAFMILTIKSGTNPDEVFDPKAYYIFVFVGVITILILTFQTLKDTWEKHTLYRKRTIRVLDYIVQDLDGGHENTHV